MKRLRAAIKAGVFYLPYCLRDARLNRSCSRSGKHFLIVRHSGQQPFRHAYFLDWLGEEFPDVRSRFELRLLPCYMLDWSSYVLHAAWLPDGVGDWSRWAYRRCQAIAARCDRLSIPRINRVERTAYWTKSDTSRLMSSVGIRMPRLVSINNDVERFRETLGGLNLPVLIREDWGHGHPSFLIKQPEDFKRVQFESFQRPIAVEFIDVRSSQDGLYRKFRYLATGPTGVTRHLMVCDHWETRPENRVLNNATRQEELAYLSAPDSNAAVLQRARQVLGLDVVAFDYSYDQRGQLVVWEANPSPDLGYPHRSAQAYAHPFVRRSFAALARHYLHRAGLPVPAKLTDLIAESSGSTPDS